MNTSKHRKVYHPSGLFKAQQIKTLEWTTEEFSRIYHHLLPPLWSTTKIHVKARNYKPSCLLWAQLPPHKRQSLAPRMWSCSETVCTDAVKMRPYWLTVDQIQGLASWEERQTRGEKGQASRCRNTQGCRSLQQPERGQEQVHTEPLKNESCGHLKFELLSPRQRNTFPCLKPATAWIFVMIAPGN